MDPVWEKILLTVVGFLVTTLCTWLGAQIVRYMILIYDRPEGVENVKIELD